MPAGALADRFGRKRILIIGLSIFTLASFFCGAASVSIVLNLARAMQGVGAALLLSAALAVLSHAFHGKERAKAFAFWGSVIGVAVMMGPVVGGLITQLLGWRWAFYVNLPIGVAMIALTAWTVSESKDPGASKLDGMGVLLFSGFLGLLTWGLISGNREGWGDASVLLRIGVALVLFVAFVLVELREKRPMVELAYFAKKTYFGASVAGIAYPVTFLTMLTYLPFFFQTALHRSPLEAGLLMLLLAVPLFAVPRVVSVHLEHRLSGRALLSIGLVLVAAGLAVASVTVQLLSYAAVVVPMFVASLGGGILNGQVAKVSMTVIPVERAGMASGVAGTLRLSGLVLGFAALGAVLVDRIAADVQLHCPLLDAGRQLAMTRLILDGHLGDASFAGGGAGRLRADAGGQPCPGIHGPAGCRVRAGLSCRGPVLAAGRSARNPSPGQRRAASRPGAPGLTPGTANAPPSVVRRAGPSTPRARTMPCRIIRKPAARPPLVKWTR
ncbi:MFS transporter [Burkholderia gladioli]|uniref:MFS transporter n=2 Tax=Burkholderia gladioli TaxID=28095 RepID=UPI00163E8CE8|nr:MFS transporter [Burkholderia gladioli]